jgi:GAF domain-containing protein
VNSDAALDLIHIAALFSPPLVGALAIPLVEEDDLLGVLTAYTTAREPFTDGDCYIAERIAAAVAKALAKSSHTRTSPGLVHTRQQESV